MWPLKISIHKLDCLPNPLIHDETLNYISINVEEKEHQKASQYNVGEETRIVKLSLSYNGKRK